MRNVVELLHACMQWDNPKEETRLKKYIELSREKGIPYFQKKVDEGIVKKFSSWSDNTGHIIVWVEFEDIEAFAKLWGDEEYHKLMGIEFVCLANLVDNLSYRLLRPTAFPEEE